MGELPGFFIVFEGGDGTGKTTQAGLLVEKLNEYGIDPVLTRQPGGTPVGATIRQILLDPASGDIDPRAETLLYLADKAQHVQEVILPALAAGKVVVCDRFVDSVLAYQGAGRQQEISEIEPLVRWATFDLRPDLTVLLDVDPERAMGNIVEKDRLEQAGYELHARTRQYFLEIAARDPRNYLVVEALTSKASNAAMIFDRVRRLGIPGLPTDRNGDD